MIVTRCPKCDYRGTAPDSFLGKRTTCKECGARYEIKNTEPAPRKTKPKRKRPSESEISSVEDLPPTGSSGTYDTVPPIGNSSAEMPVVPQSQSGNESHRGSSSRYPNLEKYLGWLSLIALIVFIISCISAGIVFIGWVATVFLRDSISGSTLFFELFATVGIMLVTIGAAYIAYVITMATIELIRVLIDIEANTRRVADDG